MEMSSRQRRQGGYSDGKGDMDAKSGNLKVLGCSYRSVLIHKSYRLVCRIEDSSTGKEEIVIVYVLDTRSNPEAFTERVREAVDSIVAGLE